ncbi:MAG: acetyltransferase [Pseudomonadota bacterium]
MGARGEECLILDPYADSHPNWVEEQRFHGKNFDLNSLLATCDRFLVGIGGEHGKPRHDVFTALRSVGLTPVTLIDESANLKNSVSIARGSCVLQSVTVNHLVEIGEAAILNTGCTVDHECTIGRGVHIMGGAAIAGRVRLGDWVVVGTNATILPDLSIGEGAYIGAGAVVTKDIEPRAVVAGVPARKIDTRSVRDELNVPKWFPVGDSEN